jgi:hypothetical protein
MAIKIVGKWFGGSETIFFFYPSVEVTRHEVIYFEKLLTIKNWSEMNCNL